MSIYSSSHLISISRITGKARKTIALSIYSIAIVVQNAFIFVYAVRWTDESLKSGMNGKRKIIVIIPDSYYYCLHLLYVKCICYTHSCLKRISHNIDSEYPIHRQWMVSWFLEFRFQNTNVQICIELFFVNTKFDNMLFFFLYSWNF